MRRSINIMGLWLFSVIGLLFLNDSNAFLLSRDLPCEYLESINITDGIRQHDDSILYNGITFPKEQYAKVNYLFEKVKRVTVDPYIRGCLCNKKSCIRLCCPIGMFQEKIIKGGQICRPHNAAKKFTADLIVENNKIEKITLDEHFEYVNDPPCKMLYLATDYNITVTQEGLIFYENKTRSHKEYCLKASLNNKTNSPKLDMLVCFDHKDELEKRFTYLPFGMLLSVPFILATILVYICLPELRNVHGKCLVCYLIGLAIGYTAMALVQLNGNNYVEPLICKPVGYLIYFSFLSAFLWLSVISFDHWWIFRTTSGFLVFSDNMRFILYMIYAWGLSSLLTFTVFILDSMPSISESFRPGIGVNSCFLKNTMISQFVFFYMPLCIICSINIIFFLLTAIKIRKVQQDLKKQEESSRHQSKFNHDIENFTLYLRLFIVMGVTWSMEGISFLISPTSGVFWITDICNTIQGVLIFVLFVLKSRVMRFIEKRWHGCFGKGTTRSGSVATNSTSST